MLLWVKTKYGELKGIPTETEGVTVFRGIPYAQPPVGPRRWREPEPLTPWNGCRECQHYGPICLQPERKKADFYYQEFYNHRFHKYPPEAGEDCLYLNIWTPAKTEEDRLPVMLWIHGGGFTQGYSHEPRTNGEVMAGNGIVVVSINYRLNIFGFFAHPELAQEQNGHCGNYGILDQIAAVRWVYENIGAFGGDSENITVAGQSAGSYSVEALSVSSFTKGMIRRAIMQSGVIAMDERYARTYRTQQSIEKIGSLFMAFAGKKSLEQLREIPGHKLFEHYQRFVEECHKNFDCCCEDNYVFSEHPGNSFAKGEEHIEALLIGATLRESQLICPPSSFFSRYMNGASLAMCHYMAKDYRKKAYSYSFYRELPGSDHPGSFHSSCIWYMFGNLHQCRRPFTEQDLELERIMNQYWVNYIKTGNPNGKNLPDWKSFSIDEPNSMILDVEKCQMKNLLEEKPEWRKLYQKLIFQEKD